MTAETGLARVYIERTYALANRALEGNNVEQEISMLVRDALDHFQVVVGFDPAATLEYFIGQLRFNADHVHESQPEYAEVLRSVAALAARATVE